MIFNTARAHVSFEISLRNTPCKEWSVEWLSSEHDPKDASQSVWTDGLVRVSISVEHKSGYGYGIGKETEMSLVYVSFEITI
jgi:hypothetical protein